MSFYRKIYPPSWILIKNNLFLTIFGLFASFLGFHEVKLLFTLNEATPDFLSSTLVFWGSLFTSFAQADLSLSTIPTLLTLILIFIILAVLLILAISSQAALIKSATNKGNKIKESFGENLHQGVSKFWPLFGLHLINIIIGYFFVLTVVGPMIEYTALKNNWLEYILLAIIIFLLLFPMIIVVSFITRYGMAYIMIKNQKFLLAFSNSWQLFKNNWIITIENAVFISIVTIVYLIAMATAMVFVFTPFFILSMLAAGLSSTFYLIALVIGALAALAVFVAATAFYGAYYNIVWAKVFIELTASSKSHSKVYRLANKHLPSITK